MARSGLMRAFLVFAASLSAAAGTCFAAPTPPTSPAQAAPVRTTRAWRAPTGSRQMPIWPGRAPDMADVVQPSESVLTARSPSGALSEGVYDVSVPTMTIFPPRGRNSGVAVIVFPGGGFQMLAATLEGTEICDWLTVRGITCILSKYRVPNGNHHWDDACKCHVTPRVPRALQDAQRTIRLVRASAGKLGIDPNRIGVMGFSAGGYLVAQTSNIFTPAYTPVDAVDRVSSRPDFAVAAYPGHLCREGDTFDPSIHVTDRTPPTFLVQAWDDPVDEICNSTLYARALDAAGVEAEVHLFAKGGHAFALRPSAHPVTIWSILVERWLRERGILPPAAGRVSRRSRG